MFLHLNRSLPPGADTALIRMNWVLNLWIVLYLNYEITQPVNSLFLIPPAEICYTFRTQSRSWFTSLTTVMQFTYQTSPATSNMCLRRLGLILWLAFVPTRECATPGKAKRTSRLLFSQDLHSFSNGTQFR